MLNLPPKKILFPQFQIKIFIQLSCQHCSGVIYASSVFHGSFLNEVEHIYEIPGMLLKCTKRKKILSHDGKNTISSKGI